MSRIWQMMGMMVLVNVMKFSVKMVSRMGFFLAEVISFSFW